MKSQDVLEISSRRFFDVEPFVDADVAAEFLSVKRKTILDWARAGAIPAHRYGRGIKLCGGSGSPKLLVTGDRLIAQWQQAVPR
jgi:excisionase family DNA binding protein